MDGVESIGLPAPPGPGSGQSWKSTDIRGRRYPCESAGAPESSSAPGEAQRLDEQKKQVGKDFESVLLTKLFEQVQTSIEDSGFDDQDSGSQQVRGLFWLYLARDVADKGGFGLGKDIYQYIKQWEGISQMRSDMFRGPDGIGSLTGSIDEEL